ncbi:MAG TPA: type II secretion system protein [Patescibacteria group bacterium]|nr:type II secretion system protein [Patescibacteria group bacterium]
MRNRFIPAFTVLELIIVIAVFGLLATLWAISWNSARAELRDAQRLSDISVLRSALSQYWLEKATYPVATNLDLGKPGVNADALTPNGFVSKSDVGTSVYLSPIPQGPKTGEYYRYHGGATGYSIRFQTERVTAFGNANVYFAHASGIDTKDEEK